MGVMAVGVLSKESREGLDGETSVPGKGETE